MVFGEQVPLPAPSACFEPEIPTIAGAIVDQEVAERAVGVVEGKANGIPSSVPHGMGNRVCGPEPVEPMNDVTAPGAIDSEKDACLIAGRPGDISHVELDELVA
jgi:hypothetical protein